METLGPADGAAPDAISFITRHNKTDGQTRSACMRGRNDGIDNQSFFGFEQLKYRPDIDGLRSVAVIPVVLYHAGMPGFTGGFVGVDVFFVISGFLITTIVANEIAAGKFSLASFYERRARRILPALLVMVLAAFAVGFFVLLPGELRDLGKSAIATGVFLSNVFFLRAFDYFSPTAEFAPLLHTWSLAVEEQFYLFFPPLLMFFAWMGWRRTVWIVLGLSVISCIAAVALLPLKPDWVFYLIPFRTWELGAGAILALGMYGPPKRRAVRECLALLAIIGIVIPVFAYDSNTAFPALTALPPVLGATILIWVGANGGGSLVNTLLSRRALVWVGLISYSLYLWHWPILSYIRILLGSTDIPWDFATLAVVASVAMAWLSFRFVERPFRAHSGGFGPRFIFVSSACSLAVVLGIGAVLYFGKGLPARMSSDVVTIAAFATDQNERRSECFNRLASDSLCAIGAASDVEEDADFLFWGDSHADAMMVGMDEAGRLSNERGLFAGHSGCPPILSIQRTSGGSQCTAFNESVMTWLEGRTDIPVVILGARWTISAEGTRYRGEAGKDVALEWIGASSAAPVPSENATLVQAGLQETVRRILATGRHVVLLGPIPEIGHDVPTSIARNKLLGWTPIPAVSTSAYQGRTERTEQILNSVADESEDVRYLPLSGVFCDADFCRSTDRGGVPLYYDDDHINQTTSLNLLPPLLIEIWQ
ncbi:acyltransferase [Aliishimia ponticola]|uniref:Acyltransferase n=1 Tax=Aliishimia ponticola TaxID=2499833 RepID=A0A4S4NB10_9RHOB|nr:acyltransferase family protein [Aliishimia ponticola]THH36566.1 acyltransferase [Aliishimia ponticola]